MVDGARVMEGGRMWKKQEVFRSLCQMRVTQTFEKVDRRLNPQVFLVGAADHGGGRSPSVDVEIADPSWLPEDIAVDLDDRDSRVPSRKIVSSPAVYEPGGKGAREKWALANAILRSVELQITKSLAVEVYATSPVRIGAYEMSLFLTLDREILNLHRQLSVDHVLIHQGKRQPVPTSFAESVVLEFLKQMHEELARADPVGGLIHKSHVQEIIRAAGVRMVEGAVLRVDAGLSAGAASFYEDCTAISSLKYEGHDSSGGMLLATESDPFVAKKIVFQTPSQVNQYRKVRKLFELGDDENYLHSDSEKIYGIASIENYPADESVYLVRMLGHHHWELVHADHSLVRVLYGQPYFPQPELVIKSLRDELNSAFHDLTSLQVDRLVDLVEVAGMETRGTILVISRDARLEAERLKGQSVPIEPASLTPKLLKLLTAIDGAILISPDATCYSIGAILDGVAQGRGDSSRGARYNSALRYLQSVEGDCIAVVVSEDGGVDVVTRQTGLE